MAQGFALGNILRVVPVDLTSEDFVDENGFFIRAGTTGYLRFCPMNNKTDGELIEKEFAASNIFVDTVLCRKIFKDLSAGSQQELATNIFVGYGV